MELNKPSVSEKMNEDISDESKLSDMFNKAFDIFNTLNKTDEPTNSRKIQSTVKSAMKVFEEATRLVSLADIFSSNEDFEEVPTENIKYFLLPALLGTLATKLCDSEDRINIVDIAEIYFIDFLRRLKAYKLIDIEIPDLKQDNKEESLTERKVSNSQLISEMVYSRNTKIQRYQQQKELEKKLDRLHGNLNNPNIDDESKREYFVTLLQVFANQAIDELASLAAERPILEHMKKIGHTTKDSKKNKDIPDIPVPKLQPIIITRDIVQKKVYGAGYPSLPVMTVQEFYDEKVKDGQWLEHSSQTKVGNKNLQDIALGKTDERLEQDKEEEVKEKEIEEDDPLALARARSMDDYKDDHKRGWGNRANRS